MRDFSTTKVAATALLALFVVAGVAPVHAQDHHGGGHSDPDHDGYPDHGNHAGRPDHHGHGDYPYHNDHGRSGGNHGGPPMDRSHSDWWRGDSRFRGYGGPRAGHYFAPGYGYYPVPRGYGAGAFVVGVVLPAPMRRYIVVEPGYYGLGHAPHGYGWYYAGDGFVLASIVTGVIVQSIAGGW